MMSGSTVRAGWPGTTGDPAALWEDLQQLVADHRLVIDRPAGSTHPDHDWITYPLDYGELEGTISADGDGLDVWRGSGDPTELSAVGVTYDPYKRDVEVKLLVGCTPTEVDVIAAFWTQHEMTHAFLPVPERAPS